MSEGSSSQPRVVKLAGLPLNERETAQDTLSFLDIALFLRRYARTILISVGLCVLVAIYIIVTSKPIYTATSQILIDPRISQIQREQMGEMPMQLDTAQIESQMALLRSEGIARTVIMQLNLLSDPEFQTQPPSLLSRLLAPLRGAEVRPGQKEDARAALMALQKGLDILRVGLSYGIQIAFSSQDPEKAARIANAIASIYVRDQIEVRSKAAQVGSLWLEEKINLLRRKMNGAARAAQEFKATHDYRLHPVREVAPDNDAAHLQKEGSMRRSEPPVTLEELESTAQTYRKLYESNLLAYTEVLQRDSYPVSNARVISTALAPTSPSHPRTQLILVFAVLIGALAGIGISLVRHTIAPRLSGEDTHPAEGRPGSVDLPKFRGEVSG